MKRLAFRFFLLVHFLIYCLVSLVLFIVNLINKKNKSGIAALPYYPKGWPGGEDRIGYWEKYFKDNGIKYDVYWAWDAGELMNYFKNDRNENVISVYYLYFKLLIRRVKLFKKLLGYKTIWIQRAAIPLFPFKRAYYEKILVKFHPNVIFDFYDADYESNYNIVMESVQIAKKVTVASIFLKEQYLKNNNNTEIIRFAIKTENILPKKNLNADIVRIGWMGSPENALHLLYLKEVLKEIENNYPDVLFSFVCRSMPDLGLNKIELFSFNDKNFNYYEWLSRLDIGIVPFWGESDRVKAKISMKSLEFMAAEVPMVCSPYVHSDMLVDRVSFMLAFSHTWYECISNLIINKSLRINMGIQAKKVFYEYHTYSVVLPDLIKVLYS